MLLFSTLLDINESMTKEAFVQLIIEWNQGSPHAENIIPNITWNGKYNIRYGTDRLWLDIEEYRNQNIVAVRYEKQENDGVIWDTDYVMNFNSMKMAIRLDRSYTAEALEIDPKFSTPYFITLLIKRGFLKNDAELPVLQTPIEITRDNLAMAAAIINGQSGYRLPVVYISQTRYDKAPINAALLASRLKGAAHVLLQTNTSLNQELRAKCNSNNEYYGAIGIYYPTKAKGHRRYLYQSAVGYDDFLLKKVVQSVIQYSNEQMIDTLFTWQGVNNALLRDKLISQQANRQAAEKAQKDAETEKTKLLDTLDEEKRRAFDAAQADATTILDSFDDEMQNLQQKVADLTRENEALQAENHGLKTKLDSREQIPLLFMGDEFEFYPGEIKDLLLAALSDALKEIPPKSRRADVVKDIIASNDYQGLGLAKADEVKRLLKDYTGMSGRIRQALKKLGFEITDDGKHYKVSYYGDGRYQTTYAKTPSDGRAGKNCAQVTINISF